MPTAKEAETSQRRPRRRKQQTGKTSMEKENNTRSSTVHNTKLQQRSESLLNNDNILIDMSLSDAAVTRFHEAAASTSSASYWKRHASLAECIVRASQSLCHQKTSSSLLLEEELPDLQSTCRTLVKEATELNGKSKNPESTLELLYVAIHGLRAVCPLLDMKRKEATLKIIYHAVTAASDVCCKSKDVQVCANAATLCLAAFQALGFLLNGYKLQVENSKSIIGFKWKVVNNDLFPVPSLSSSTKAAGTMPVKQIYKIAMQATLSVGNALAHLHSIEIRSNDSVATSSDFGPYTAELIEQSASYETILRMSQEVVLPWTTFFCSNELATSENIQDSLSHAKRVFRLLFDVASQIDKCISQPTSSRKDVHKLSPVDSLLLRKYAIIAFLLTSKDTELSQQSLDALQEHHLEAACTYACKATSMVYRLQQQSKQQPYDECLDSFHADIGSVLDSFATTSDSIAYIEYCAHRALHASRKTSQRGACDTNDCVFQQLGFRFQHETCLALNEVDESPGDPSAMAGQAALSVFFLVLTIQGELDAMIAGEKPKDSERPASFEDLRQDVVGRFRSVFVKASQLPSYDAMSQCMKILELLSLNRKVYQILSAKDSRRTYSSGVSLTALETLGRVLAECIGPLAVSLVKCGKEGAKMKQHWELAVDCYSRGLVVFDRVNERRDEESKCNELSGRIDDALRGLFPLCHDSKLTPHLSEPSLEKTAKTIFSIGRVRKDRKEFEQALLPLCLGNDLFSKLAEIRGPQSVHDLQLSTRYSHLSSTFDSLGMKEEAFLSVVLAIVYDMIGSAMSEKHHQDVEPIQLLRKLSSFTNGVVLMEPRSEARESSSSLVGRLVLLSDSLLRDEWSLPSRFAEEDFAQFICSLLRRSIGLETELREESPSDVDVSTRLSLASLLSFAFKDNKLLRSARKIRMEVVNNEQVLVMADVAMEQGALVQRESCREDSDSYLLSTHTKELKRSFLFLESLSNTRFRNDKDSSHVSLALVCILSAVSLVPESMTTWPQLSIGALAQSSPVKQSENRAFLSQARNLLSKAQDALTDVLKRTQNEQQRLLSNVLLSCVVLFSSQISGHNPASMSAATKTEILSSGREAVHLLLESDTIAENTREDLRMCLTRTLTRFQDMVDVEGDKLAAAQAALLVARIHDGTRNGDESWYWAVAGNLLHDSGLFPLAQDLVAHHQPRDELVMIGEDVKLMNVIRLELVAAHLRTEVRSFDANDFKSSMREAQDLANHLSAVLTSPEIEPFTRVIVRWICCSVIFAMAEGLECHGSPSHAIRNLRQGLNLCRESISALRKLRNYSNVDRDNDPSSDWAGISTSTFLLRVTERRISGQKRLSTTYALLGDHRRSEAYAVEAARECILDGHGMSKQRLKIDELAAIDRNQLQVMCQTASYRLLLEMKAKASPSNRVLESLRKSTAFDGILTAPLDGRVADEVAWQIDYIWNLMSAGDVHYGSMNHPDERFKDFYRGADSEMKALLSSPATVELLSSLSDQCHSKETSKIVASLHAEVKLRCARVLLSEQSEKNEREAKDILVEISDTATSPALCRAWALYYLALMHIRTARQAGALQELWMEDADVVEFGYKFEPSHDHQDGKHAIETARSHLHKALALVGPASDTLSRDVMRSLALLTGRPSRRVSSDRMLAASLIHSSIGATTRQVVSNALCQQEVSKGGFGISCADLNREEKLFLLFSALDTPFSEHSERKERLDFLFDLAKTTLPSNCRVVAVALCPTGEILISSMSSSADSSSDLELDTVCIFPDTDDQGSLLNNTVYDNVMKPLDELVQRNENQIRGLDTATAESNFKDEMSKRDWWSERQILDDELESLVEDVQSKYFSSSSARRVFVGDHDDDDISISCGNLASKFEQARTGGSDDDCDSEAEDDDVQTMTTRELKEELERLQVHVTTRRKPSKQQLIDMLTEARRAHKSETHESKQNAKTDENCMLLVLDENLHRFPFEGLDVCSSSRLTVSRVPSLPFAIVPLLESRSDEDDETDSYPSLDTSVASYIVDPEGNLSQTKKRLVPAIKDICESNDWNWKSVVGSLPSQDFVQRALTQRKGLLLYCGHGGATCCFSRSQVEALMKADENGNTRRCQSSIILMGCSSGKLVSVNRKDSNITDKVTLFYEPEGIALSYLCAGAPCIVGNLWDVTDRDIDRYCITLLDKFLGPNSEGHSLAKCAAEARSSCKMRHVVGLAPVCYGVPVFLLKR